MNNLINNKRVKISFYDWSKEEKKELRTLAKAEGLNQNDYLFKLFVNKLISSDYKDFNGLTSSHNPSSKNKVFNGGGRTNTPSKSLK